MTMTTPSTSKDSTQFDLAVLGGGSAGFAAAIRAAEMGASVALINAGTIGGTCINVGCIPSKALIRAAEAQHTREFHPFEGIATSREPADWNAVRAQKDELVESLRQAKYIDVLPWYPSITFFDQRGTPLPSGAVRLEDRHDGHYPPPHHYHRRVNQAPRDCGFG